MTNIVTNLKYQGNWMKHLDTKIFMRPENWWSFEVMINDSF